MNIPKNFAVIGGKTFTIGNNRFIVQSDPNEPGDLWVTCDKSGILPLCFDIDWKREEWALIRCHRGKGRNGNVLATNNKLLASMVSDADTFINTFIRNIVSTIY